MTEQPVAFAEARLASLEKRVKEVEDWMHGVVEDEDGPQDVKELFREWFRLQPGVKNPTDLNTEVKFDYATMIGFDAHRRMEQARKQGIEWTKWEYWEIPE